MKTNNDIINKNSFNDFLWNYTGISTNDIESAEYETNEQKLGNVDLAIQEVRFHELPFKSKGGVDLSNATIFIIYRPEQEKNIDDDDIYVKRSFPNYFYMVEKDGKTENCYVREMTGAGPVHGMKNIKVKNMHEVIKLIRNIAYEADCLDIRIKESRDRIASEKLAIDNAKEEYYKETDDYIKAADMNTPTKEEYYDMSAQLNN